MLLARPLRGIVPPMVTPLIDRDTLDRAAVARIAGNMIEAGVSGIFVLGTTGEAASLSYRLRAELVDAVCSVVAGRVPVLVGVTDTAFIETVNFSLFAATAGASALVLAPPYYFPLSQAELLHYIERITRELPLPVYLYNIPSLTKAEFAPATVREAANLPNVYGLKDSSGDMEYFGRLIASLADRPEFAILCGPEELLAQALAMGAHGGIAGGANLAPDLFRKLYEAAQDRNIKELDRLQVQVLQLGKLVYQATPENSSYLRGIKGALSVLGYCRNVMAEPFEPYGPEVMAGIRDGLAGMGLLGAVIADRAC